MATQSAAEIKQATVMDLVSGTPASEIPLWSALVEGFDTVMQRNVDEPNRQLIELRFLKENFDREILQRTCRMLGFDITQDVLDLQTDLTKLTSQLPLYADHNGTYLFEKFIELLLNGECEIDHLWAQVYQSDLDHYYDWTATPQTDTSKLVYRGGNWIRTTHIDLRIGLLYGATSLDSIVLRPGQTLFQRVVEIFYDYAPIALVIRYFWFIVKVKLTLRVGAVVPAEGYLAYLRLQSNLTIIHNGQVPAEPPFAVNPTSLATAYYNETDTTVAELYGEGYIRAQLKSTDVIGRLFGIEATNSLAADLGLPTAAQEAQIVPRPADGMTGTIRNRKIITPFGAMSVDKTKSRFTVKHLGPTFSLYSEFYFSALNPVQWPTEVKFVVIVHYDAFGEPMPIPSYFIEKSVAAMFSNFRLNANGPILNTGA